MQNLIKGLQKIDNQIKQLRREQNEIFVQHGKGLEGPEFMQDEYRNAYDSVSKEINVLDNYLMRVRSIVDSASHYIFVNLS